MGVGHGRGERMLWWKLFALLALASTAWMLTAAPMSGPDEHAHAARAAAVARLQPLGHPTPGQSEDMQNWLFDVRIPRAFADVNTLCFYGKGHYDFGPVLEPVPRTDDCQTMTSASRKLVTAPTYQFRTQPAYYFVVGLPSLALTNELGVYLMRFVGVLLCSAMLATAVISLRRLPYSGVLLLAVAVVLTPSVLYLAATMNNASLEIAAALCAWMAGFALVRSPEEPDGRMIRRLGVALVLLAITRPLAPAFAVVILGVLALLAEPERRRRLLRRADLRRWLGAGALGAVFSGAWVLYLDSQYPFPPRNGDGFTDALREVPWWSREMVGVFGSTDVVPPVAVQLLWVPAVLAVFVVGARHASRLQFGLAMGLLGAAFVLLVSGQGLSFPQTGYYWQGRYVMPLVLGAVLVAALPSRATTSSVARGRAGFGLLGLLFVAHMWSLLYALRHYTVGYDGTTDPREFLFDPIWSPPVPPILLVVLSAASLLGLAAVVARSFGPTVAAVDNGLQAERRHAQVVAA